jgi:emp24/gp25L/p24 family/GOLD
LEIGDVKSHCLTKAKHKNIFFVLIMHFIIVKVTSPGGNTVLSLMGKSGDKFEFKAPRAGMHKFCFHNKYGAPETISFYIHVGHIPNEHDLAKDGTQKNILLFGKFTKYPS